MRGFFKIVFATLLGLVLFCVLLFIFFSTLIAGFTAEKNEIKENSVLKITLDKKIVERETGNFFNQFARSWTGESGSIGLLELREAIREAGSDERIKGIFLNLTGAMAGFATLEELRNQLLDFKKTGKFIIAYADFYTEGGYYLASVADKIYLPPSGVLEFNGLNVEILFFKNLLEKLEIEPEVFKVGQYKSAVEPFINDRMSAANREQIRFLLESAYSQMIEEIAISRKISAKEIRKISDSLLIRKPEDALNLDFVTDIAYSTDAEDFIKEKLNLKHDEEIHFVQYDDLIERHDPEFGTSKSAKKVAVIYAVGEIREGKGDENNIGSESLSNTIAKAREDSSIKAIVLRVNSPGGSALASDVIWKEIKRTSKVKPVVASMSDLAASGGYYISAACDTIVAHPVTITGSIGVFGVMFNGKGFLNNKLHITSDHEQTGPYSDLGTFTRPLSGAEKKVVQQEVEDIYQRFITIVAEGRHLDTGYVNAIAQGRVWSGTMAKDKKLVDVMAGLDQAVKIAADRAGVEEYETVYLPEIENALLKQIFNDVADDRMQKTLQGELGEMYGYLKKVKALKELQGTQARLPFDLEMH